MRNTSFEYVLAIDCETTGLVSKSTYPARSNTATYQAVAWGVCVVKWSTMEVVDHYKGLAQIRDSEKITIDPKAMQVHGLTPEYLLEHGKPEVEVILDILDLIVKYWGTDTPVVLLGHNVHFDQCFLVDALKVYDLSVRFSNRVIDTNTLGCLLLGSSNSDEMFRAAGVAAEDRGVHCPLEDILMTVLTAHRIRDAWDLSQAGQLLR